MQRTAVEAARLKFSPEFMNRLDKVVVFHPLHRVKENSGDRIGPGAAARSRNCAGQFLFRVTPAARNFCTEGTDQRYGARREANAIERNIVFNWPIFWLLNSPCERLVRIDWDGIAKASRLSVKVKERWSKRLHR